MTIPQRLTLGFLTILAFFAAMLVAMPMTVGAQAPSTAWRGEYFANPYLSGSPLVREEGAVNFAWGVGAPMAGLPADNFSVRWTRSVYFEAGRYRFTTTTDDGVRLFLDGALLIDQWRPMAASRHTSEVQLAAGTYTVRLEYFEATGEATAQLGWNRVDLPATPPATITGWRGEYFNNRDLAGNPALVRDDPRVDFAWGSGSPDRKVQADNFSARWTRTLAFVPGRYRFTVRADDGVRLYVDNNLLVDQWQGPANRSHSREIQLSQGNHTIRLDYVEQRGDAAVRLSWEGPIAPAAGGNLITCVPPYPSYSWIKLYRLQGDGSWVDVNPRGYPSLEASGWLKIDGLEVDYARYGEAGHPYRVEQWVDGKLARSTGATERGEPAFRLRAGVDNLTPWQCTR